MSALQGFAAHWAFGDGRLLVSRERHLYAYKRGEPLWHVASLPLPLWRQTCARLRVISWRRAVRISNVVPLSTRVMFVSFGGNVVALRDGIVRSLPNVVRGTQVADNGCALAADGAVYFGASDRRSGGCIRVYRWHPQSLAAEVVYTFGRQSVAQLHGIWHNPHDGSLWCATGSDGDACRILRSDDGFASLQVVGAGDASWHTRSLCFAQGGAHYVSGTPQGRGQLFRIDLHNGQRDMVGHMPEGICSSTARGDDAFFSLREATAARAAVWQLDARGSLDRLFTLGSGGWSQRAFGNPGILLTPQHNAAAPLYFSSQGIGPAAQAVFEGWHPARLQKADDVAQ